MCVLMTAIGFCFVMELLHSGKLVPFRSLVLPWHNFVLNFFLSRTCPFVPWAATLQARGVAREARPVVAIGKGGVRSVGMF